MISSAIPSSAPAEASAGRHPQARRRAAMGLSRADSRMATASGTVAPEK